MVCEYPNKSGVICYLHTVKSANGKAKLFYFCKTQNNKGHEMIDLPENMEVILSSHSGHPLPRKKK